MDYIRSIIQRLLAPFLTPETSTEVDTPPLQLVENNTNPITQSQQDREDFRVDRVKAELEARKELGLPSFQEVGEQRLKAAKELRALSERVKKLLSREIVEDDDEDDDSVC